MFLEHQCFQAVQSILEVQENQVNLDRLAVLMVLDFLFDQVILRALDYLLDLGLLLNQVIPLDHLGQYHLFGLQPQLVQCLLDFLVVH